VRRLGTQQVVPQQSDYLFHLLPLAGAAQAAFKVLLCSRAEGIFQNLSAGLSAGHVR
jgi:hypothetical protein